MPGDHMTSYHMSSCHLMTDARCMMYDALFMMDGARCMMHDASLDKLDEYTKFAFYSTKF